MVLKYFFVRYTSPLTTQLLLDIAPRHLQHNYYWILYLATYNTITIEYYTSPLTTQLLLDIVPRQLQHNYYWILYLATYNTITIGYCTSPPGADLEGGGGHGPPKPYERPLFFLVLYLCSKQCPPPPLTKILDPPLLATYNTITIGYFTVKSNRLLPVF